jgi:Secretion system C-terminal sorting domain
MNQRVILLTASLLCFFNSIISATTITSATTGNWTATTTWLGGVVPTIFEDVVIATGHNVSIDPLPANAISACKSLTVNGKLIYASTARFTLGDFNNRTAPFIINGTFEYSVGYGFTVYGYAKFNTGSVFRMTSGGMIIDGSLGATTSVPTLQAHLDVTNIGTLDVSNSTIAIRNPHFDGVTPCIAGAKFFGNTIAFGSGTTPDVNKDYLISLTSKPVFTNVEVNILNTGTNTSLLKAKDIQIEGAVSVVKGTFYSYDPAMPVKVKGDFNVNQGVAIIGNFEFNGTGQQNINPQYLSGATLVTFQGDLIVNNPTEVKSKINTTIQGGNLRFQQGRFDTENKLLTLERTPIGTNSSSYLITYNFYHDIGTVLIQNLAGNTLFPVGTSDSYTPVWIDAASGNFKVSATLLVRPPNVLVAPLSLPQLTPSPSSSFDYLNLKWDITRVFGPPTANLTFQWNTSNETPGFTGLRDEHCAIFHHNGTAWENLSRAVGPIAVGSVFTKSVANVSSFSPFTLFAGVALPVEITAFSGKKTNNGAKLSWTTASEKDNAGFEIERSVVANIQKDNFETIGFVKSQGSSNVSANYEFWDNNFTQTAYYRLKITDANGKTTYSKVITIANDAKNSEISVFPNPILRGPLNFQLAENSTENDLKVEVLNTNGQVVAHQNGIAPLQTDTWQSGVYFVKIVNKTAVTTLKVVKH